MSRLVLLRHGESEWNAKNLFTGWVDVDLSAQGVAEATREGAALAFGFLDGEQAFEPGFGGEGLGLCPQAVEAEVLQTCAQGIKCHRCGWRWRRRDRWHRLVAL